jgi:hypothetical protein
VKQVHILNIHAISELGGRERHHERPTYLASGEVCLDYGSVPSGVTARTASVFHQIQRRHAVAHFVDSLVKFAFNAPVQGRRKCFANVGNFPRNRQALLAIERQKKSIVAARTGPVAGQPIAVVDPPDLLARIVLPEKDAVGAAEDAAVFSLRIVVAVGNHLVFLAAVCREVVPVQTSLADIGREVAVAVLDEPWAALLPIKIEV